jgi:ABC-type transport system substrate-binding protein
MKFLSTTRRSLMIAGLGLLATTAFIAPSSARAEFDLNVVQGSDVDTLDPAVSRSVPSQIVFSNIFNTLVKWKDPSLSEIVPDLAESWSGSEDGRTWTFKLRKGVNFSDGTPFNAEAVKFNLDRIVSPELGSPNRSQLGDIVEVKVVDPATVEIITKNPAPTLIEKLTQSFASMNSPTAVEKDGKSYSHNPVGTGPYILSEWMPGERVVLKRNPNYFGMAGKPDTITFRAVPEGSARVIELQTGNADIALNIEPKPLTRSRMTETPTCWWSRVPFRFSSNSTRPSRHSMTRACAWP